MAIANLNENRQQLSARSLSHMKHGMSRSVEYGIWAHMIRRCKVTFGDHFRRYGSRGISVCEQWCGPGGFERFFAEVGPRPSSDHSIDRIDNNGSYEPGNVRWATRSQQANNRTTSLSRINVNGVMMTLSEIAKKAGLRYRTARYRLNAGWTPEEIISTPLTR